MNLLLRFSATHRRHLELPLALLIGAAAAFSVNWFLRQVLPLDLIHHQLTGLKPANPLLEGGLLLGGALLPVFCAWIAGNFAAALQQINRALFPLLIPPLLLLVAPNSYLTLILLAIPVGIAFYRVGFLLADQFRNFHLSSRMGRLLISLLFLGAAAWGFFLQERAYRAMFLYYNDWGEYAENYLKLAFSNETSPANWLGTAGHWNPAVNVVMASALWLCPSPRTLFLINALVIYSAVPLCYALARRLRLPVTAALLWGGIAFLNPVLSNQPLALFYGFHPINFLIPVLLGFFLCRAAGCRSGMWVLFLFSLLIQETVTIFWAGYALYLMFERRWRHGIVLFSASLLLFWSLSSLVMPRLFTQANYAQMFHYGRLGSTPLEVLCSPFLRPAAFWGTVLQWQNFAFAAELLLPLWLPVLIRPKLAVAALPLLAGVCLQESPELKNIVMQYGVEITTLLLAVAIFNTAWLRRGKPCRLLKLFEAGLPVSRHPTRITGVLMSLSLTALLLFRLAGCYPWQRIRHLPTGDSVLQHLRARLPEEGRVVATQRLRPHFLFTHPTAALSTSLCPGDLILLDLHDSSASQETLERVRSELAAIHAIPLGWANWHGSQLVAFQYMPHPEPIPRPPFLQRMSAEEFARCGIPLTDGAGDGTDFDFRLLTSRGGAIQLAARLRKSILYDVDLIIEILHGGRRKRYVFPFAYGLFPAYTQPAGTVFFLPLPAAGAPPETIRAEAKRRPFSAAAQRDAGR